jgi:hypothetical protein
MDLPAAIHSFPCIKGENTNTIYQLTNGDASSRVGSQHRRKAAGTASGAKGCDRIRVCRATRGVGELTDVRESGVDVDVEGDLCHPDVEEREAGLPCHQNLLL